MLPEKKEKKDSLVVPSYFIDTNHHMNNTRYLDLAEDCAGMAAEGKLLKEICTEYTTEARFGDTLMLRWTEDAGRIYFAGEKSERPVFRITLQYV